MSKKDETLVELLMGTGMPENVARMLAFVRKKEETTSVNRSIHRAQATQKSSCRSGGGGGKWIIKRDIKKEGQKRPVHSYKLAMRFG